MTANAPPRSSLAAESLLFAGRLLTHWRRQPAVLIQALLFPTFLLITYKLLVGKSIMRITGTDSLYGLVPMCAVAGAMFGALAAGRSISLERDSGLLSQTVGVSRAPGQRPDRQAARRGCAHAGECRADHSGRRWARTSIQRRLARRDPVPTGAGAGSCRLLDGGDSDRGAGQERCRARLAGGAGHRLGVLQLWCCSRSNVAIVDAARDPRFSRCGRRLSPCGHLPKVVPRCGRSC